MPPLGTKLPANRTKKPPSCDHCKQKRVLCHPNPAGCPRCVEKGIECTTTPVIRRKPTKRRKNEESVDLTTPSASTSPRASTADPSDLPVPPAATDFDQQQLPTRQTSMSNDRYPSTSTHVHEPLAPPLFDTFQLVSLQHSRPEFSVSPELARHLFKVFDQTPQHEHPIFATYTLERTLQLLDWRVELLPSHSSVLAYCIFAVGSLMSYHPSILDPYHLNFGGACPDSFKAVLEHLPDLRKFGKLRAEACRGYREEALRRAKESDILFVASDEAATACHLLAWLESTAPGGCTRSSSVWYAAEMSHTRALEQKSSIPKGDIQIRWACYLLMDSLQALFNGEIPPCSADQLHLVGPNNFCETAEDREVERQAKGSERAWPHTVSHIVFALELSRKIYEELVGPWVRDVSFDFSSISSILEALERRRLSAILLVESLDRYIAATSPSAMPFHHFPSYSNFSPSDRVTVNGLTAMRSLRTLIQISWAHLTLIAYENLSERQRASALSSSSNRHAKIRLDFCVEEARRMALHGLEATIDSFDHLSSLATWTHLLPTGLERWARFVIDELSEGRLILDSKVIKLLETLSSALKQEGYVWSNHSIDSLILSLDSQILGFHLATNSQQPQRPPPYPPQAFPDSTHCDSFDPCLSLFANLTSLSTPSTSSAQDYSPPIDPRPAQPSTSTSLSNGNCSTGAGVGNDFDELSRVLGLH